MSNVNEIEMRDRLVKGLNVEATVERLKSALFQVANN
jgi:hypothetical protein